MPTIYKANLDGTNAIQYVHLPIVRFYLEWSHRHASNAQNSEEPEARFEQCLSAIVFSSLALEAFANEMAEDLFSDNELADFLQLRRSFTKQSGESTVCAKLRLLFKKKYECELTASEIEKIELLADRRNKLIHYKPSELAGEIILPPVQTTPMPDGKFMTSFDFTVKPEKVEPPFALKLGPKAAAASINTSLQIIRKYGRLSGVEDSVPGLEEIT